ncbi:hypothetical protein M670_02457 [Schinkia azotoformans MEV2011]|uniref:Uncharacterized protein n=2 Tax=Schinkia azotoformans TaxID=1454 RepID=A0A072NNA0_SCHAZ|nr:hypothetical protein [Schinkia azotoformans]KEF38413.1 hypothetical protein M670_02457 [Schinkia azotoformans MEV2011]MEC1694155.1 hypothetical protein [Schinkia azotoformans]MEC1724839.1 hypothetical protein [Schinkia azotoformans]MEC1741506.1 hypothetical protein [Schinkia azotoformans]MEC1744500.1 hypothetical protein [Schinkia azotoformans]
MVEPEYEKTYKKELAEKLDSEILDRLYYRDGKLWVISKGERFIRASSKG